MTWPTPAQMTAARRAGKAITIGLPDGRQILLEEYVRSWRILITVSPTRQVAHWSHFPISAGEILTQIRAGIHERINRHIAGHGTGAQVVQGMADRNFPRRHPVEPTPPAHLLVAHMAARTLRASPDH